MPESVLFFRDVSGDDGNAAMVISVRVSHRPDRILAPLYSLVNLSPRVSDSMPRGGLCIVIIHQTSYLAA